jgi:hypothetical protein
MIPRLDEIDACIADDIHQAVLLRNAPRPDAWAEVLERLRLADAGERITHDGFDKRQNAQGRASLGFDPVAQVFTKLLLEDGIAPAR